MKYVILVHSNGKEIAVNRDAIVYVEDCGVNTKLYLNATNQEGHMNSLLIKEPYNEVVAKLNAE